MHASLGLVEIGFFSGKPQRSHFPNKYLCFFNQKNDWSFCLFPKSRSEVSLLYVYRQQEYYRRKISSAKQSSGTIIFLQKKVWDLKYSVLFSLLSTASPETLFIIRYLIFLVYVLNHHHGSMLTVIFRSIQKMLYFLSYYKCFFDYAYVL